MPKLRLVAQNEWKKQPYVFFLHYHLQVEANSKKIEMFCHLDTKLIVFLCHKLQFFGITTLCKPKCALWHYRLWSFKTMDTKLERFLNFFVFFRFFPLKLVYFLTKSRKIIYLWVSFPLICVTDFNFGTKNNGRMK